VSDASKPPRSAHPPHPVVWTILYIPFGAFAGFVQVALTFLATQHGLSITEGALLNGAQMLTQWLKWLWAPVIDITLTPKRWYNISTILSAAGIVAMASIPLSPETLPLLLTVIAVASLINSIVGMAIESMMAAVTPKDQIGRVSGWFQAGNLGGAGLGGGLGLLLLRKLPAPWMTGVILGGLFLACCLGLLMLPNVAAHQSSVRPLEAVKGVVGDLRELVRTRGGRLAAILCFMPVGSGAAQVVLAQAEVAARWGAGAAEVEKVQGFAAGGVTVVGCFLGGYLCERVAPRTAYAAVGILLAAIAAAMGLWPPSVTAYVIFSFVYAFGVGLAYAAFTAVVLDAMGAGSAATKYNIYASLSNFPIWWMGLVLGRVADVSGPKMMLLAEAGIGVLGVLVFAGAARVVKGAKA
jgi:PAT family beta-lactamase induction signal transducer AmpG